MAREKTKEGERRRRKEKVSRQKSEKKTERGGCGLARSDLWRVAERGV